MFAAISAIINACTFVYGGIVDYKRREIPNAVPVILLLTGLLPHEGLLLRLISMFIVAGILLVSAKIAKAEIPGGDFKLLCALTFSCGMPEMLAVLLLAGLGAAAVSLIRRQPLKRNIPLCTYAAAAYLLFGIIKLIMI